MPPAPPQFLPPIEDPIIEDSQDDKSSWEWYFGENAGGYLLWFGRHEGKKLHQIPESYLRWCLENMNHPRVLSAVKIYYTGLEELTKTDYDRFIIPFGTKHKGQTIRQCRDKPWLEWATKQSRLVKEFPLFFLAVDQWLGNPRKYGVQRDIGDLLRASEYHDDIDIKAGGSDDEPNSSDNEFIDDSDVNVEGIQQNSQESDMDTSDETQATGEHQTQETDMDSDTNDGSQGAGMSEHDNTIDMTTADSEEDSQMDDAQLPSPSPPNARKFSYVEITPRKGASHVTTFYGPPEARARKLASPKFLKSTDSQFIVEDGRSDSGSQSYRETSSEDESEDSGVSRRVTRSLAKVQNSAKPKVASTSRERPSRLYKKVYIDTGTDDEQSQVPISKTPRRARPSLVILSDSESSTSELPLSRDLFSQTRAQ